jgi:transposase InsO family protein
LKQSDHQEVTVPWSYPSSVRRQVALRLRGGEPVAEIAEETGISPATLFRWKDQALVDAGCAILNCFSKMIVARTFSTTADTALVNNAVDMAARERTRLGVTVLHADHGPPFTSWTFGENLRRWSILESLGTVGDCFDNAAIESFWGRLQTELLDSKKWATTLELTIAMAGYIENFYNSQFECRARPGRSVGDWPGEGTVYADERPSTGVIESASLAVCRRAPLCRVGPKRRQ